MSFRSFLVCFAGLLTNLWMIGAILTPILPTDYHQLGPRAPRAEGYLPPPGRAARVPVRELRAALSRCFVFESNGIIGLWNPSIPEALAADSAFADALLGMTRYGFPEPMDSAFRAMRNDARQVIGVDRFIEGRSYLINGYEPDSNTVEGFVTKCLDPRWRWSIEYTPGTGFHHFSMFRDTCEDPRTPEPTPERSRS